MEQPDWNDDAPSLLSSEEPSSLATSDLPEVQELLRSGWQLAPEAPALAFLPAVWPVDLRTWVKGRGTQYSEVFIDGEPGRRVPADAETVAAFETDMDLWCDMAGVPSRPAGRIWLLRVPEGSKTTVGELVDEIRRRAKQAAVTVQPSPALTRIAIETLREVLS